jgi:antitoxin (DNA-binding transcriptional repressor) of toxin-antitoxin stability system
MKKANISKIKAELSKYLRYVKQGEEVLILDRERVVAQTTYGSYSQSTTSRARSPHGKGKFLMSSQILSIF